MTLLVSTDDDNPMVAQQVTVLAIGPWDRGEFALVSSKLNSGGDWLGCVACDEAAATLLEGEFAPEFILIAQPLPGDVSQEDIEALRRAAPLAQIVIIAGSWCEGELRTGHPPEGVLRMYWHELLSWWPQRRASPYLDSLFASRCSEPTFAINQIGSIAISSPSLASFETLASTLALASFDTKWIRNGDVLPENSTVGIWDGGQLDDAELVYLKIFATEIHNRGCKLVVLIDYPQKQHFELLNQLGCHAVLGKPYVIEELIAACIS